MYIYMLSKSMLLIMRSEDISLYVHTCLYLTGNYLKFLIVILNNINEYLFLIFSVLHETFFYCTLNN